MEGRVLAHHFAPVSHLQVTIRHYDLRQNLCAFLKDFIIAMNIVARCERTGGVTEAPLHQVEMPGFRVEQCPRRVPEGA